MSFIQRELDRIRAVLGDERTNPKYAELYAAQQALAWASEPTGFRSPLSTILDTQEDAEDCSGHIRPPSSSNRSTVEILRAQVSDPKDMLSAFTVIKRAYDEFNHNP